MTPVVNTAGLTERTLITRHGTLWIRITKHCGKTSGTEEDVTSQGVLWKK